MLSHIIGWLSVFSFTPSKLHVGGERGFANYRTKGCVTWKIVPGCRHGKLFIGRTCKKRADDLLKLGRYQLKTTVSILTGHAPVRGHLRIMGLFSGDPSCRFCRMETETVQHITCCCETLARQRYNIFGKPLLKPKDISTATLRDLCLFIRDTWILNLCWWKFRVAQ
jgi:hypothetical protein